MLEIDETIIYKYKFDGLVCFLTNKNNVLLLKNDNRKEVYEIDNTIANNLIRLYQIDEEVKKLNRSLDEKK